MRGFLSPRRLFRIDTQQCITAANVVVSPRVACRRQFFDLHDMFVRWVNLPQCKDKQLDYSQFLQALGRFQDIPEQEKVRLGVGAVGFGGYR